MIAFVTSLRHPDNSADYDRVELLLHQTLASVAAQDSEDWISIVVGNRRPAKNLPRNTVFVPVDFPPPARSNGPHAGRDAFVRDKGTKIGIGLVEARRRGASKVMIFDADDFVHRSLAAFATRSPDKVGWVFESGWMYSSATGEAMPISRFNRTCGTSMILPIEAYGVPEDLERTASQSDVLDAYGETLTAIMGAHRNAVAWLQERGWEIRELPFRGAVYHVDTGENHSGKTLRAHARDIGAAIAGYVPRPLRAAEARLYGVPHKRFGRAAWWLRNGAALIVERVRTGRR
ncbi:hypothetical protein [Microbacterium sp. UBA837]|uniref:hypothetical protein n=1 Tax=Microbacterium sp. UBA837 TaxID=1946956 RepID=UPI0025DA77D6|nr:hypothetical protein [Microbacterium sp. UBA837]